MVAPTQHMVNQLPAQMHLAYRVSAAMEQWKRSERQCLGVKKLKNFYACRRSRVQARSNPGTGDQGGRCTTYI